LYHTNLEQLAAVWPLSMPPMSADSPRMDATRCWLAYLLDRVQASECIF